MALASHALVALVVHGGRLEPNEGDHTAQEEVDLLELCEAVERAGAHQAVVGVVVDALHAQAAHEPVEALRGGALEGRVGVAPGAHAVHHVAAVQVGVHHGAHRRYVVLPVAVDGDGRVAAAPRLHEAAEQGVLVAAVARQAHAPKGRVPRGQPADDLPGAVRRAVVHKEDMAGRADLPRGLKLVELGAEEAACDRQHLGLVVAGDDDAQHGWLSHVRAPRFRRCRRRAGERPPPAPSGPQSRAARRTSRRPAARRCP